ncbi:MAG: hypothetical protein JWP66_1263 [Naasia sp.]|nr:hypothetical protein [Naasia sp.]
MRIPGLVLAAGAGSRFGGPKVLAEDDRGPWLSRSIAALRRGGADPVIAVFGAAAEEAEDLLPAGAQSIVAHNWQQGVSASLRAGLDEVSENPDAVAVVVTLVDLPAMPAAAVARLLAPPLTDATLRQAVYDGRPGHPVVLGRGHWPRLIQTLSGDTGARPYLVASGVEEVECGDLWPGDDVDRPRRA